MTEQSGLSTNNTELHIFTNTVPNVKDLVLNAHKSFNKTFGELPTTIWYNDAPYRCDEYLGFLVENFSDVRLSSSLSDGYITAIEDSKADFMFMLEHDWIFHPSRITHSLQQIQDCMMSYDQIFQFRFNKRHNRPRKSDRYLHPGKSFNGIYFCVTPSQSNNPHMIHRERYLQFAMPHVRRMPGSEGIEERLMWRRDLESLLYGPMGYPPTIKHTDGRGSDKFPRKRIFRRKKY